MKPIIAFVDLEEKWESEHLIKGLKDSYKILEFKETVDLVADQIKDAEILSTFIQSRVTHKIIDCLPNLKLITTRSTGYDHIDTEYARDKGITVCNVPTYGDNTVAEHAFALIMSIARNLQKAAARIKEGDFSIKDLMGFDLKGKTLGVVGTGHIGLRVIKIAVGFGMNVIAYTRTPNQFLAEILGFKYVDFDTLLKESDIISLHAPYNKGTHHMINMDNISKIKKGAILINTARGGLVETAALAKALDDGIIAGAGLDVLEGEDIILKEKQLLMRKKKDLHDPDKLKLILKNGFLLQRENVLFTSHVGFYSKEALMRILDTTIGNIRKFSAGTSANTVN